MVFAYPKYSAMGREEERKKVFLAIGPLFDVKPDECPCCHGRHIVRYGHVSSNGRGRYLCKDCHKTFCGQAGTLHYRGRIEHTEKDLRALLKDTRVYPLMNIRFDQDKLVTEKEDIRNWIQSIQ